MWWQATFRWVRGGNRPPFGESPRGSGAASGSQSSGTGTPGRGSSAETAILTEPADETRDQAEATTLLSRTPWWGRFGGLVRAITSWPNGPYARALHRATVRARRSVYRSLPLSTRNKLRLRNVVLRVCFPLSGDTTSHEGWREDRATLAQSALPRRRVPQPADSNVYEEAYRASVESATSRAPDDYVPLDESGLSPREPGVKVVAFYLPQFHPVSANDAAWGRGFTEWTNVSKAVPQFLGHYQPRLPGELGFYDLRVPEVQRRQVELAKLYGLHGFCFHFYWFGGKRVLERPLEQFYADKSLDLRYCLCWANENWTRRWDGSDQDIVLAQEHTPEHDVAVLDDISKFLEDPRYIRVDGRPLLIVYRAQLLPDAAATAARWRERCRQRGIPNPYLVAARTFDPSDSPEPGFDATVEFPPHNTTARLITDEVSMLNKQFRGQVFDYRDQVSRTVASYEGHAIPVFRAVCPGWDNEARRPGAGNVFVGSEPGLYGQWLTAACAAASQSANPDMRLVFVNAWNEWAEGAYLEPDRRYGYAYLAETKAAVDRFTPDGNGPRVAVIAHVYYDDVWPEIRRSLYNIPEPFDLYVTVPPSLDAATRRQLRRDFPRLTMLECENRGRDVLPFLKAFRRIGASRYDLICKIHSKKTIHRRNGAQWRERALGALLESPRAVDRILAMFGEDPDVAMVGPEGMVLQSTYYWGVGDQALANRRHVRGLAARMGVDPGTEDFYFVAGSMFWFRPSAFGGLLDLDLADREFEAETGQRNGTLAHAMERVLGLLVSGQGLSLGDTAGRRFEQVRATGRPADPDSVRCTFAHPTFDGEPL